MKINYCSPTFSPPLTAVGIPGSLAHSPWAGHSSRNVLCPENDRHVSGSASSQKEGVRANGLNLPLRFFNTILILQFPKDQILSDSPSILQSLDLPGRGILSRHSLSAQCWASPGLGVFGPIKETLPVHSTVRLSRQQRQLHLWSVSEARLGKEAAECKWREGATCRESRSLVVKTTISKRLLMLCLYGFLQM